MAPTLLSQGLHDHIWPALQVGSDLRESGTNARVTSGGSVKRGDAGEQEEGRKRQWASGRHFGRSKYYAKEEMDWERKALPA
uniref:Uncharacterized protein n=1 Tax=Oryza barthii TaxID=65489 RepID=A0A0D3HLB1_9ORYZ